MERVTGIGGFFFRAADPDALGRWYDQHLGVPMPPPSYDDPVWWQETGPTVWGIFPADTTDLGNSGQSWSINFRVSSLEAMVAQLERAGIAVTVDPEEYPNGRFASLADPEGNVVQLWEPNAAAMQRPG